VTHIPHQTIPFEARLGQIWNSKEPKITSHVRSHVKKLTVPVHSHHIEMCMSEKSLIPRYHNNKHYVPSLPPPRAGWMHNLREHSRLEPQEGHVDTSLLRCEASDTCVCTK
jgi:hypothetical protein